jgi:hypothetical protein
MLKECKPMNGTAVLITPCTTSDARILPTVALMTIQRTCADSGGIQTRHDQTFEQVRARQRARACNYGFAMSTPIFPLSTIALHALTPKDARTFICIRRTLSVTATAWRRSSIATYSTSDSPTLHLTVLRCIIQHKLPKYLFRQKCFRGAGHHAALQACCHTVD